MLHPCALPCILPRHAAKASPVEPTQPALQRWGSSSVPRGCTGARAAAPATSTGGTRLGKASAHAQFRSLILANRQPGSLHAGPPLFYP